MTEVQEFRITLTVDDFDAAVRSTATRSACPRWPTGACLMVRTKSSILSTM